MKLPTTPRLDPKTPQELVRLLSDMARQINGITEGQQYSFHSAVATLPTEVVAWGDFKPNPEPTELGAVGSKYIVDKFRYVKTGATYAWVPCIMYTGN